MNVAAILKGKGRSVTSALPTATLSEISKTLAKDKIGAIVIVDEDDHVTGIISERDVIQTLSVKGGAGLDMPVRDVMTRDVVTCREADTLDQLMAKMTARRFRHLPVVEDETLCGIVSIGDVVKHHIAEVEMEASALREYIATG